MANIDENFYMDEVKELTNFIRNDNSWDDLRSVILKKGFNLPDTLLVSFVEDEEEMEYGVIVTRDKRVFEYSRSTAVGENNLEHFKINEITGATEKFNEYPQINVSFKMIDEEQL